MACVSIDLREASSEVDGCVDGCDIGLGTCCKEAPHKPWDMALRSSWFSWRKRNISVSS